MKILITGSGGFVGTILVRYFSEQGIEIHGIDIVRQSFQKYDYFKFHYCDITEKDNVDNIVKQIQPTHVIHCAWLMKPQHDLDYEFKVDVTGSKNIIDAAFSCSTLKQFLFFSSASVYGGKRSNPIGIKEDKLPVPGEWVYAQNKVIVERYLGSCKKPTGVKVVIVRMCTACGPSYFRKDGLVDLLAGSKIGLLIDGRDIMMQFIHEDDLAAVVGKIVKNSSIEGLFNFAPDEFAWCHTLKCGFKLFIPIPKLIFRIILSILWYLKIGEYSPMSTQLLAESIVVTSKKLQQRLNYKFSYSTKAAFFDDAQKRGYC